jgi:hypothetical protein
MKLQFRNEQFAVFDDVLGPEQLASLWTHFQNVPFRRIHDGGTQSAWRLEDGNPLVGPVVMATQAKGAEALPRSFQVGPDLLSLYPTGQPVDAVMAAVIEAAAGETALVGKEGPDWAAVIGNHYVYPQGTGLSWHADDDMYSGAFIFYAHPEWSIQWGGELFVAETAPGRPEIPLNRFANDVENEWLMRQGLGRFVFPKPNRLVFVSRMVYHRLLPVAAAAGNKVRASVAGFFMQPAVFQERLAMLTQGAQR